MSIEITTAFVNQYRANVIHLAQQKGSKLRNMVTVHTDIVGKADHFDRIGKTAARKVTTRHADSPLVNTPHSRRRVNLEPYDWGDLVDREDKIRTLISPENEYVMAGSNALGRSMDDIIITALGGNAYAIDELDASTSTALPAGQKIAHGGTAFTLAKWRQAKQILDDADVEEENRVLIISPRALYSLLGDSTVTSADYNNIKALVGGELNQYLGFSVIKSTRLPKSGNIRAAYAYHMAGVGLTIGSDIVTRVAERPDKRFSVYVYACMDLGATRIEEERVVEISYDETA